MFISVKIIPNSKKLLIEKLSQTSYRIKINAPAIKGKANEKLVEALSEYFNVPKSAVTIVTGHKGRNKVVEVKL